MDVYIGNFIGIEMRLNAHTCTCKIDTHICMCTCIFPFSYRHKIASGNYTMCPQARCCILALT